MTRAQRVWHARLWLLISLALAVAVAAALVRREQAPATSMEMTS